MIAVALAVALVVLVAVLAFGRSSFTPAFSRDGIPLPFGGSSAPSLAGSISVIRGGPMEIREISFDQGEVRETLQGPEHVDRMDFVLTPQSETIAHGAPLGKAFSPGKRIFGYIYTSRDAAAEKAAAARLASGDPVTFAGLFPGTFFASDEQRGSDASIENFERQRGIMFHALDEVTVRQNARMIVVVNDPDVTLTVRGLAWCGDSFVAEDGSEECDDGNAVSGDGCSGADHPNGMCTIEMCGDHYVDLDGIADSAGDRFYVEQCDDGGICIGGPRDAEPCTTAGLSLELMAQDCGVRADGGPAMCVSFDNDGCSVRCHVERCGDGIRQTNEQCDPGGECVIDGSVSSQYSCTPGVNDTETRDRIDACVNHGGTCRAVATQTCTASCQAIMPPQSLCGNGTVESGEECDDGNTQSGDGCTNACRLEETSWTNSSDANDVDGNGRITTADADALQMYLNDPAVPKIVTPGYTPVPRYPDVNGDGSVTSIDVLIVLNWIRAQCGNGQYQSELGEQCDDGNTVDDDSCDNACQMVANPFVGL